LGGRSACVPRRRKSRHEFGPKMLHGRWGGTMRRSVARTPGPRPTAARIAVLEYQPFSAMSRDISSTPEPPDRCPSCGASITPEAVLCVACGYHFALGHHLATVVERQGTATPDPNPYASPVFTEKDQPRMPGEPPVFDLTDAGARQAQVVVWVAQSVFWTILLAWCVCAPAWLVILPWYAYRLYCWHRLSAQFAELRSPNAFSPHGELAANFKDARSRLLIGVIAGCVFWTVFAVVIVVRVHSQT
jgi:hypothetical protein